MSVRLAESAMITADCRLYDTGSLVDVAAGEHVQDDVAWMGMARLESSSTDTFEISSRCAAVGVNSAEAGLNFS